jgi:PhzF family phenazine biosynthesis protein
MELKFVTLDVFTGDVFRGNPLAVVTIPAGEDITDEVKQLIAREFNYSETVFIYDTEDTTSKERMIRIFTTTEELPFAGHPTIGTAVALKNLGVEALITKAGRVPIDPAWDGGKAGMVLAEVPFAVKGHAKRLMDLTSPVTELSSIPAIKDAEMKAEAFNIVDGMTFILVELPSLELLGMVKTTNLKFNKEELLDEGFTEAFVARYYYYIAAADGDEEEAYRRVHTRMVEHHAEDPATGSAACALASFLTLKLSVEDGEDKKMFKFQFIQGEDMGRRSDIRVITRVGGGGESRTKLTGVWLGGTAKQVMSGTMVI